MATLILLNGPPGVGKSTLAQRYVDDHRLALNLDIDRIRALLGGWRDDATAAGLAARAIALAAARTHLAAGSDVVVPQLLAKPAFILELEQLAAEVGAAFVEIVLLDSAEATRHRFAERTRLAAEPAHIEAADQLQRAGGSEQLDRYHADLLTLIETRPAARVVHSVDGEVEQTYARLRVEVARALALRAGTTAPTGDEAATDGP